MSARRLFLPAAPLVMMLATLSACGGGPRPNATGDNLVVSIGISEPKRLIPSTATESEGAAVLNALFTPLVEYDEDYEPVEVAAESITTSDNQVWTIRLRPGWQFHNGEPVTADSYINAWNAGAYGPNAHDGNYFFEKIVGYRDLNPTTAREAPTAKKLSGLAKKDDLTFEVTLGAPYVNFKSMLGYTAFLPLPQAAFADVAANTFHPAYEQAPIGQGPFQMKGTWQHDQQIETERHPGYAGPDAPKVAGILFKIYQQQTTQYQDLLAGQLDVVIKIMPENVASARADLGDRYVQTPASLFQFLAFPTFDPKYAKVEIRRAISMAIDRDEIATTIFLNSERPARSFVSPVVPGYRPNTCGETCEFHPEKAKALFDAHGGAAAVGGRIEIAYNVDGGHKPWIDAACHQLRRNLGVDCVGNPQPKFAELLTMVEKKQPVGMFRMGWIFDYPAMENYLGPLYTTNGSSNYYGYSNREFDRLVAAGDRAATPDEATTFYQQAEDILARDLPVIPMRFGQNNFGFSRRVKNVQLDLFNRVLLSRLEANTP
jgi:peptide/nickel transport system substrate-binding protein/oligopeptide transport system substrate-binding protein